MARLLQQYGVQDPEKIKGTGVRGMLTKGDVLAFLGKASSPTGTFKPAQLGPGSEAAKKAEARVEKVRLGQLLYRSYSTPFVPAIGWSRNSPAYRPKYVPDGAQGPRWNRLVQQSMRSLSIRILMLSQYPRYWQILILLLVTTSHHPQLKWPQNHHLCYLQNRNRVISLTGSHEPLVNHQ